MDDRLNEIVAGLASMNLSASDEVVGLLRDHLRMVLEANEEFNLTSIHEEDAVALHVLDSCAAVPFLLAAPPGAFADIGSGAGYPGIPLCALTGRRASLVESVGKKARFLEHVVDELRLNATVHRNRAEELAQTEARAYSAVTARAVSSLPSLVELAAPLLVKGGHLICLKGAPEGPELQRGRTAAALCGMREIALEPAAVPGSEVRRTIVVYERWGKMRSPLPRRPGMAQRRPLA